MKCQCIHEACQINEVHLPHQCAAEADLCDGEQWLCEYCAQVQEIEKAEAEP